MNSQGTAEKLEKPEKPLAREAFLAFSPFSAFVPGKPHMSRLLDIVAAWWDAQSVPTRPCELCNTTMWTWHPVWHRSGRGAWACAGCVTRPTPTLAEVHAELNDDEHQRLDAEADGGDQVAQLVLHAVACTPAPAAWRLYSRRLDRDLWVARDIEAATALDGARAGLPVVLADDLERLRDFDDQRLNDVLEALALFPGTRLSKLDPKAEDAPI
jgi:hypothetical protein